MGDQRRGLWRRNVCQLDNPIGKQRQKLFKEMKINTILFHLSNGVEEIIILLVGLETNMAIWKGSLEVFAKIPLSNVPLPPRI